MKHFLSRATIAAAALGATFLSSGVAGADQPASLTRPLQLAAARLQAETTMRPLAMLNETLALRGEVASDERAIFLTQAEALRGTGFRISFSNAVSNLPEASRLILRINDQTIGEVRLDAFTKRGVATIAIPPGVLGPGYNAIRFVAVQRHRVDCSVKATYELWSEISLADSGIIGLAAVPTLRRLSDLPALAASGSEQTVLRVRVPRADDTIALDRAMQAVNAVILAARIQRPRVEIGEDIGEGAGIDLMIGGEPPQGAVQLDPEIGLFHSFDVQRNRSSLTLRALPGSDVDTGIRRLTEAGLALAPTGTGPGRRALANTIGRRVASGSTLTFDELGHEARLFDGRFLQSSVGFVMPSDFFPAPYGSATLILSNAFLGEASTSKRINVRINDQIAAVVPLQRSAGQPDERRIELPMEMFKAGSNALTIEADLAGQQAGACDATAARGTPARLMINGTSRLSFGQMARVTVLPSLSATLTHGYPYGASESTTLAVSASDKRYLNAAMTWIGQMTAARGRPLTTSLRFGALDEIDQSGLFFGPPAEASQTLGRMLSTLPAAAPRPVQLAAAGSTTETDAARESILGSTPGAPIDTLFQFQEQAAPSLRERVQLAAESQALQDVLQGNFQPMVDWLQNFGLVDRPRASVEPASGAEAPEQDLMVLQQLGQSRQPASWHGLFETAASPQIKTLVLAASPEQVEELVAKATTRHFWTRMSGDSSIIRMSSWGPENRTVADPQLLPTPDFSPANIRLAIAGWFALNPGQFLLALAGLALLLALSTAAALGTRRP